MLYVTLRNGKVLRYNNGGALAIENGALAIRDQNEEGLIARIPLDVVERAEFERPCRTFKERPLRKLQQIKF